MNENEKTVNAANDEVTKIREKITLPKVIAAPEVKKMLGKKPLLIAVAAVVVIAIVVMIASAAMSSPLKLVGKGLENSIKAFKQNSVVTFAEKVANGGSIEAVCDMEGLLELPVEGAVSLKLYTAAAKAAAITANVEIEGDAVLDASAFFDKENFAVASDVLFGNASYGTDLTSFAKKFNDSEFGPDGELSLGIELPDAAESVSIDTEKMAKEGQAIAEDMLGHMLKSIKKHTEVSKEKDALTLSGEEVKVTAVAIQADSEALTAVCTDLIEYLRSDKALKEYLYDYADYFAVLMVESDLVYGDYEDAETIVDEFYAQLDEIGDEEMENMAEAFEDADVELSATFYITKSGKELIGVEFVGDADGDKVKASVIAGPSWENIEEISVRLDDGYSAYRISYTVETNDKKEYSAKMKVREDGESIFEGTFAWDKKTDDFEVELTDEWGDAYGIEGSLEVKSKSAIIVLDSIYTDYDEMDLGISLTIATSDKMPKMPKYTEILDMSADDFEELAYDLEDVLYELSEMFY